jgi:hypothetical protein
MVLGIEPLIYETGLGFGMQNKDMVVVTERGCELMSDCTITDQLIIVRRMKMMDICCAHRSSHRPSARPTGGCSGDEDHYAADVPLDTNISQWLYDNQ